jgi:hypothetical protein
MLAENNSIKTLLLRGNDIGDREIKQIADGLMQNQTLRGIL